MLDLIGPGTRTCDGVSRRDFIRVGGLAAGGLTLANTLRAESTTGDKPARRKAVIQIWQAGGPSHIDMYDLKPGAPSEFRGEFKQIPTNVPGI